MQPYAEENENDLQKVKNKIMQTQQNFKINKCLKVVEPNWCPKNLLLNN